MHQRIGKYHVIRAAGYGGFGTVYEGYDSELDRNVAIKICTSDAEDQLRRFEREARIVSRLQHPRIAIVYDYGFDIHSGLHYLVEEFLSGVDLEKKVVEQDDLPVILRLRYLLQMAQGLKFVHERGLIHRDLSSRNVRVLHDHSIKLMDFGLARDLSDATLTLLGENFGTVNYTAPEQLDNMRGVDLRTDIFSFGVIAYELLTFRNPYQAESMGQFMSRLRGEPTHIGEAWPQCPPVLGEMIHRCLRYEPDDRYASCNEILKVLETQLEQARQRELPPAPPPPRLGDPGPAAGAASGEPRGISTRPGLVGSRGLTISLYGDPAPADPSASADDAGPEPAVNEPPARWRRPASLAAAVLFGAVVVFLATMTHNRTAQEPAPPSPPPAETVGAALEFRLQADAEATAGGFRVELSAALPPGLGDLNRCHVRRRPGWSFGDQLQSDCGGQIFRHTDRLEIEPGRVYSYEVYLVDAANEIVASGHARSRIPASMED